MNQRIMTGKSQIPVSHYHLVVTLTQLQLPAKRQISHGHQLTQMTLRPLSPYIPLWLSALPFSSLCILTGTQPLLHGDWLGKHTFMVWGPSLVSSASSLWSASLVYLCAVHQEASSLCFCTCSFLHLQAPKLSACFMMLTVTKIAFLLWPHCCSQRCPFPV